MFVYAEKIPLSILRERSPSICLYSSKAYTAAIHSKKLNSKQQTCLLNAVFLFVCLFYFFFIDFINHQPRDWGIISTHNNIMQPDGV